VNRGESKEKRPRGMGAATLCRTVQGTVSILANNRASRSVSKSSLYPRKWTPLSAIGMSASGQKRTSRCIHPMSALALKADIRQRVRHVRLVPIADVVFPFGLPYVVCRQFRSLFYFYNADGFSIWNSYAFICTSAAASVRSLRGASNLRCGHESPSQNRLFAQRSR
jgi:hypothetical protein